MSDTLDLLSVLGEGGDKYAKILELLAERAEAEVAAGRTDTAAARKAEFREDIEKLDVPKLMSMQEDLVDIVDLIVKNEINPEDTEDLTDGQVESLMREHQKRARAKLFFDARYDMVKQRLFNAITERLRQKGKQDPAHVNGSLPAPAEGKRFARQGCGRTPPLIDEERLAATLGERWEEVCDVEEIPEQIIKIAASKKHKFSLDKYMALARQDLKLFDILQDCLIPGQHKKPSLGVHSWKPER